MKLTQKDIQYVMNEANNIIAEQREQRAAYNKAKKQQAQGQMDENIVDTAKEWGNKIYDKAQQAGKAVAAAHDPKKRNAGAKMMASKAGRFAKKGAEAIKKAGIGQSAKQLSQQQQQQQQGQK